MENSTEPSSSISFTSSSFVSNSSTSYNGYEAGSSLETISLNKLSNSLEQLLLNSSHDYSDAEIVVEKIPVGVHRCILAARSKFFDELFKKEKDPIEKESKPKYCMSDLLPYGAVGYEAFIIFLSYLYTGKLKPSPLEVSTCIDDVCVHDACRPAVNFSVELMYASAIFQVPEMVSLFQRRLFNLVGKALVEDVIPILLVAFRCQSSQLLIECVQRVARSDLDNISLEKELPYEVAEEIKLLRVKSQPDDENALVVEDSPREKRMRSIHKALDSDDVELVKLLLNESADVTLDEANALHYAVAYCDPKVVSEVLGLGLADVNLRNARGYTVLHVAAMRKEPSIIVSLLSNEASASETTRDGQTAFSICRRLTRQKDYNAKIERGQEVNKDRICIDILDREMRRNQIDGNASIFSQIMPDELNNDLHMKLLYLENRVAFALLFYPTEAKLAMGNANAETTFTYSGRLASKGSSGNLKEVDLNETPIAQNRRLLLRIEALSKTVETGRRYFPHCSQFLDNLVEEDLDDLFFLEKGTPDEQKMKMERYIALKEDIEKEVRKDKAELNRTGVSTSSSSFSLRSSVNHKARKLC